MSDRATPVSQGGESDFFEALLDFESGISPAMRDLYLAQWREPSIEYWKVDNENRLLRTSTDGSGSKERIGYDEYFRRLGLPTSRSGLSLEALKRMRYAATNPWGFVGFQFGEALLTDLGHYSPSTRLIVDRSGRATAAPIMYVGGLPDQTWAGGRHEVLWQEEIDAPAIIATSTNTWRGAFTGLDGANSFSDLQRPDIQTRIMVRAVAHSRRRITQSLDDTGLTWALALSRASETLREPITISGCLAAAHLCGAEAAGRYLIQQRTTADEAGTTLESYLLRFSGYEVEQD